jgi:hypothetical protein
MIHPYELRRPGALPTKRLNTSTPLFVGFARLSAPNWVKCYMKLPILLD